MNTKKITAFLMAFAMLFALSGCSSMNYNKAEDLMAKSEWTAAKELLVSLDDYEDSRELLKECDYNIALGDMEIGNYEDAISLFEALGEYKDSPAMLTECNYNIAVKDMESGDYDAAIELFEALSDYKDSADMLTECRYLKGVALYDAGSYEDALAVFTDFDDYKDAARYFVLCSLLTDQAGFADTFAGYMDILFSAFGLNYNLEMLEENGDERIYALDGPTSSGNTFVCFSPLTEDGSNRSEGQINGIAIMSDALTPSEIITVYPEFAYASGIMLSVLCDDPDPSDEILMINDLVLNLSEKGTVKELDDVSVTEYRFDHNGYDCLLTSSDFGDGCTRFLLTMTIPELKDVNNN